MKLLMTGLFIALFSFSSFAQESYIDYLEADWVKKEISEKHTDSDVIGMHKNIQMLETVPEYKTDLEMKMDFIATQSSIINANMSIRLKVLEINEEINEQKIDRELAEEISSLTAQSLLLEAYQAFLFKNLDLGKVDDKILRQANRASFDRLNTNIGAISFMGYFTKSVNQQLQAENKHLFETLNRLDSAKYAPATTGLRIKVIEN